MRLWNGRPFRFYYFEVSLFPINLFINFSQRSQSNCQKLNVAKKYCALVRETDEKVPMAAKKKDLSGKIQIEKNQEILAKADLCPKY